MPTNFPTSLDALENPTEFDSQTDVRVEHWAQHSNANDAIEALQAKVGIDDSGVTTSLDYIVKALMGTGAQKPASSTFRVKSDGTAQIKNDDDGLWYTLGVRNIDGMAVLYIADTGE